MVACCASPFFPWRWRCFSPPVPIQAVARGRADTIRTIIANPSRRVRSRSPSLSWCQALSSRAQHVRAEELSSSPKQPGGCLCQKDAHTHRRALRADSASLERPDGVATAVIRSCPLIDETEPTVKRARAQTPQRNSVSDPQFARRTPLDERGSTCARELTRSQRYSSRLRLSPSCSSLSQFLRITMPRC
jgi:hypothetical protein